MTNLPVKNPDTDDDGGRRTQREVMVRIEAFLSQRSPTTYETYLGILKEWSKFLGADFGTVDSANKIIYANEIHSMTYLRWLSERPGENPRKTTSSASTEITSGRYRKSKKLGLESLLSNATIHKKIAALRRIYKMLLASRLLINDNPFDIDTLRPPPKDSGRKRPTEMVPMDRVVEILREPSDITPKGIQDRAILACLFGGGLRRSEIVALKLGDVRATSQHTCYLYLRATKAGKDAEQALPGWAAEILESHVNLRKQQKSLDGDPLFCTFVGRGGNSQRASPISNSGVYKLFKLYCKKIGLGSEFSPHSARATAITRLLDAGIPHRKVKQFSRHASIQMVEHYDKHRTRIDDSPAKDLEYAINEKTVSEKK